MDIITLALLAVGLSFDSFAVSVSSGLLKKEILFWQAVRIAIVLAAFQAVMPIIGWLGGLTIRELIAPIDHWIALGLLSILGIKMILESRKEDEDKNLDPLQLKVMVGTALATSIDALVVGVSFALVEVNMIVAFFLIGSVTFVASMLGILFGKKTGAHFGKRMEVVGGIILIAIGVRIAVEHCCAM